VTVSLSCFISNIVVDPPANAVERSRNPTVSAAPILAGQFYDIGGQGRLIVRRRRALALRGTTLPQKPADQALGHSQFRNNTIHKGAAAGGAQKFPSATSFKLSFSTVRSAARRSLIFSAAARTLSLKTIYVEGEEAAYRGALPAHLPRIEVTQAPEDTACPSCQVAMTVIGGTPPNGWM
jgi:hypothetical protein